MLLELSLLISFSKLSTILLEAKKIDSKVLTAESLLEFEMSDQ